MENQELITKRLALIKYLFNQGVEQSKQTEPLSAFSILSFHDSIEMFLKLLSEVKNINSDKLNFIEYWGKIPTLTLKESMRNLNVRRVNFKHKGILPSKSDIEICRINTTDFFEQNTLPFFNLHFNDVSIYSLISYESVRKYVETAKECLDKNDSANCIGQIALAFDELLTIYEENKSSYLKDSPFYFGKDISSAFSMGLRDSSDKNIQKIGEFVDKIKDSLTNIQSAVKIMSYGIDYKKYFKFKTLTPIVTRITGGNKRVMEIYGQRKWTKENCLYCIDFVVETALKLIS